MKTTTSIQIYIYHIFKPLTEFGTVGDHDKIQHHRRYHPNGTELYEKATSAVLINGTLGDWFRTTIGVRQGCILSPTLFNIFLEEIMT